MKRSAAFLCALILLLTAFSAPAEEAASAEIHHVIIDTDTGSDDAAALMMAGSSDVLDILGITVLYGNVDLEHAAMNAMMVMETCGLMDIPVCIGAVQPLRKARENMISVHGADGMGDQDLIHPTGKVSGTNAVRFILDQVAAMPGEVEIVAIGPLTNIALALAVDPITMSQVKRLWIMGTTGFGPGNATPVAEFNVYSDPDAYDIVLSSGLPITIVGLDCMVEGTGLTDENWETILNGNEKGHFTALAFSKLMEFYRSTGKVETGLPDPLAMAALIWPEYVLKTVNCDAAVCTNPGDPAYGQVIFYQEGAVYEAMPTIGSYNIEVVTGVDPQIFMDHFIGFLTAE